MAKKNKELKNKLYSFAFSIDGELSKTEVVLAKTEKGAKRKLFEADNGYLFESMQDIDNAINSDDESLYILFEQVKIIK